MAILEEVIHWISQLIQWITSTKNTFSCMDAKHNVHARNLAKALALIEGHADGIFVREPSLPVNVAAIRRRIGMTQEQFAARFGFSVATLRHWERGNRRPRGAALVLLSVIARNPRSVR